jgi:SNF2 family DNA or RNA helicase
VDWNVCVLLRRAFPALKIGEDLTAWAWQERERQAALQEFHGATSAEPIDLPRVREHHPTLHSALQTRGYQTLVPAFAREVGSHFNASQPGTGKTIETLATIAELDVGKKVLVVAPKKAIQSTWPREIDKWLQPDVETDVIVCDDQQGNMKDRNEILRLYNLGALDEDYRFRFVLINPEAMRWIFTCEDPKCNGKRKTCPHRETHSKAPQYPNLFKIRWDAIILDETHKMMMNANERSANVSGWGYGAQKLLQASDCLKIGLSGTPFKGKPRRFWTVLHWLRPDKYTGQWKWVDTYFESQYNPFSAHGTPTDTFKPGAEDLFNQDLNSIMIRHTKHELRKLNPEWAPPEKQHAEVMLEMDPKQRKAYEQMVKDAAARLADGEITANGILAERTRLKQFATAYGSVRNGYTPTLPSNKWEWIKEALADRGLERGMNDGDTKIVIASQYVKMLEVVAGELDRMGIGYLMITGGTKHIDAVEQEWQSAQDDKRVLLLSTMAGGVSLTLDAADDLVLIDETDNPDDQEQTEDRVHRTSRTDHQVTIYHLISEGTIDESISAGNLGHDFAQKAVLDGRRGVEYARKALEGKG